MSIQELTSNNIDKSVVYLTLKDISEKTGYVENAIQKHISKDYLRAYRFNRRIYIHPKDFDEYKSFLDCGVMQPKQDKKGVPCN